MSTTRPRRVKRTKVLSTKVTERDNRFLRVMVDRYFDNGIIPQAKTSTLLRLIVKRFLRRDCPEYAQKTSISYQQEISKLYSDPKDNARFPHNYQIQKTNYTAESSQANTAPVKRSTSYAD